MKINIHINYKVYVKHYINELEKKNYKNWIKSENFRNEIKKIEVKLIKSQVCWNILNKIIKLIKNHFKFDYLYNKFNLNKKTKIIKKSKILRKELSNKNELLKEKIFLNQLKKIESKENEIINKEKLEKKTELTKENKLSLLENTIQKKKVQKLKNQKNLLKENKLSIRKEKFLRKNEKKNEIYYLEDFKKSEISTNLRKNQELNHLKILENIFQKCSSISHLEKVSDSAITSDFEKSEIFFNDFIETVDDFEKIEQKKYFDKKFSKSAEYNFCSDNIVCKENKNNLFDSFHGNKKKLTFFQKFKKLFFKDKKL